MLLGGGGLGGGVPDGGGAMGVTAGGAWAATADAAARTERTNNFILMERVTVGCCVKNDRVGLVSVWCGTERAW